MVTVAWIKGKERLVDRLREAVDRVPKLEEQPRSDLLTPK
jgi:hypothetical protein